MLLNFDSPEPTPELKTPILVVLFRAVGVLDLIVTLFGALAAMKFEKSVYDLPTAIVAVCIGLCIALVSFGIAEVILLIAKIEHNTSAQKDAAILTSLHRIEGDLKALRQANPTAPNAAHPHAPSTIAQFDAAQVVAAMEAVRRSNQAGRSSAQK